MMRIIQKIIKVFTSFLKDPVKYLQGQRTKLIYNYTVFPLYRKIVLPYLVWRKSHRKVLNVIFIVMNPAMWRCDKVFLKMKSSNRFHPIIVATPSSLSSFEEQIQEQEKTLNFFQEKGYEVVPSYAQENSHLLDLHSLKPDIIFYQQPYSNVLNRSYNFEYYLNCLICYTPYAFPLSEVEWNWNNPLQNYCWRQYCANEYHYKKYKQFSRCKGRNVLIAGYSLKEEIDEAKSLEESTSAIWQNDKRKRIIWAPHHSIEDREWFKVSSFLDICFDMIEIRDKYLDQVVFAFKPHPALKNKLYKIWGEVKTEKYYENWANSPNSFYTCGEYQELFVGSDAMIHCSGSFIVDYLLVDKPVQYVYSKNRNSPDLGVLGNEALSVHYQAHSSQDIDDFIQDVVLKGRDPMKNARNSFVKNYLTSSCGKSFSENVFNDILQSLS